MNRQVTWFMPTRTGGFIQAMPDYNHRPGKMWSDKIISFGQLSVPGQFPRWIIMNYLNVFLINGLLKAILYKFSPLRFANFGLSLIVTRLWYCSFCSLAMASKSRPLVKLCLIVVSQSAWSHIICTAVISLLFTFSSFVVTALKTLSVWSRLPQLVNTLFIIIFIVYY